MTCDWIQTKQQISYTDPDYRVNGYHGLDPTNSLGLVLLRVRGRLGLGLEGRLGLGLGEDAEKVGSKKNRKKNYDD